MPFGTILVVLCHINLFKVDGKELTFTAFESLFDGSFESEELLGDFNEHVIGAEENDHDLCRAEEERWVIDRLLEFANILKRPGNGRFVPV